LIEKGIFVRHSHLVLSVIFASSLAGAVKAEEAVKPARALFNEGRELIAKGNVLAACPKFEQSLALEGGLGTQFNLADCWERTGRLASAHALFLGAAASAKASGQVEREQVLRERALALEPRISKLVIEVEETDARLSVKRDALPLEPNTFGRATAVDPGSYVISAKAPGKKPWSKTVEVKPGVSSVVTVSVPKLEAEGAEGASAGEPNEASAPKGRLSPVIAPPPPPPPGRTLNYRALGLGGVGVAAVAVGTVMALRYKSANDEAKGICPTSKACTPVEIDEHGRAVDRASVARTWTYVGFGVGGASLLGAAALLIFDPPRTDRQTSLRAVPHLGTAGVFGASLDGSF
jgi:hypothetical protein